MAEAVFTQLGSSRFLATELARGPWDPALAHGGAPSALIGRVIEQLPEAKGMLVARISIEFFSAVPLGEMEVQTEILRPGKRMLVIGATLEGGGRTLCRATAVLMRTAPIGVSFSDPDEQPIEPPSAGTPGIPSHMPDTVMFGGSAIEVRFLTGHFIQPGPGTAWFRWLKPLVEGEESTPLQLALATADFGNGISNVLDFRGNLYVNTDLTVHLERYPRGEWLAAESKTTIAEHGIGLSRTTLRDIEGTIGCAEQALFVDKR